MTEPAPFRHRSSPWFEPLWSKVLGFIFAFGPICWYLWLMYKIITTWGKSNCQSG